MLTVSKLCFAVMDPTEIARWDQVVDMDVPQRGTVLCLVLAEQPLELTPVGHFGATEAKPARYLGEVTAAVGRIHRVHTMGPEFMGFGPITTIVDDADQ